MREKPTKTGAIHSFLQEKERIRSIIKEDAVSKAISKATTEAVKQICEDTELEIMQQLAQFPEFVKFIQDNFILEMEQDFDANDQVINRRVRVRKK